MNKKQEYKEKFYWIFLVVVILSGLSIYGWNLLQGNNLAQPPKIDLEELNQSSEQFKTLFDDRGKDSSNQETATEQRSEKQVSVGQDKEIGNLSKYNPGYVYFKDCFRLNTAEESRELIAGFLMDFPGLAQANIEMLNAVKKVELGLPLVNGEEVVERLEESDLIKNLKLKKSPVWSAELDKEMFLSVFKERLVRITKDVKILTKSLDKQYVARINYVDLKGVQPEVLRLKKEFSNMVWISE
ncbi:MAG TPA: hypothetical protein VKP03_00550 [Patescibacteria group bacterium]|nr:hypothetical protein [Patescibacteria group bacterium]